MSSLWCQSLQDLRSHFFAAGQKYPELRCGVICRNSESAVKVSQDVADFVLECRGFPKIGVHYWDAPPLKTEDGGVQPSDSTYWEVRFFVHETRIEPAGAIPKFPLDPDATQKQLLSEAYRNAANAVARFEELASDASWLMNAADDAVWNLFPAPFKDLHVGVSIIGNASHLWLTILFGLSVHCPKGSYLRGDWRSVTRLDVERMTCKDVQILDKLAETGEVVGECDGKRHYIGRLAVDPFRASVAAIDLILSRSLPESMLLERSPKEDTLQARRKRPCEDRDKAWRDEFTKLEGLGAENVYGKIRDWWNGLSDTDRKSIAPAASKKIGKGKPGYDCVRKAIERFLKDNSSDGGN